MKRIISALMIVCCIFALFACAKKDGGDDTANATVSTFQDAIANTSPAFAKIETKVETSLGELKASFEITYKEDGSAVIEYAYEKFNTIDEGAADEEKTTVEGTVTRAADGTVSGDATAPDLSAVTAGTAIDLSAVKAENVTISESGDTLTATVAKDDTDAVFGAEFPADVTFVVTVNAGKVDSFTITYEGAEIKCNYNF